MIPFTDILQEQDPGQRGSRQRVQPGRGHHPGRGPQLLRRGVRGHGLGRRGGRRGRHQPRQPRPHTLSGDSSNCFINKYRITIAVLGHEDLPQHHHQAPQPQPERGAGAGHGTQVGQAL